MTIVVNCQHQQPAQMGRSEADTALDARPLGLQQNMGRCRRHLTAYISTNDIDDDVNWLLIGAAAAAGLTSSIAMFAVCSCCYPLSRRYR